MKLVRSIVSIMVFRFFSSIVFVLVLAAPAVAQRRSPFPTAPLEPSKPAPAPMIRPAPTPGESGPKDPIVPVTDAITVLRYEVEGSTVFTAEELAKVTQPFTGKVTFTQLQQAANAVQQLYTDRRYLTTGAYLPDGQTLTIDGAVVKIQVLEGKLEDIRVTGNQHLRSGYVRSRLGLLTGAPLNHDRLLEAMRLLQQNPLIDRITAELSTGKLPGTNLLEVKVKEANPVSLQLSTDNNRSPSIGTWQRRLQLGHGNLLGFGDGLTLGYSNTQGSNAFDVGYSIPLSPTGTTLSFNFGVTHSNVIENPFTALDIISDSRTYDLTLRQPLFSRAQENRTQELAIGLTAARIETETSLLGEGFKLSDGADPIDGTTRISALRFFQEYLTRDNQQVFSLRSQFNLGLNAFNSTINESGPDSRFFHWQGSTRWLRRLGEDFDLIVQGRIQLADRPLPALEQFAIGGIGSVRGYRQDFRLADSGAALSAELQIPLWRSTDRRNQFHITPFLEAGTLWNQDPFTPPAQNTLASTGLGLLWRSPRWTAKLEYGIPLIAPDVKRKDSLQENGLYFSLRYSPF